MKPKAKRLKKINGWEWETLVAAWRYYEHGGTISASAFPCDIIERYFRGAYDHGSCMRIARQFVEIDHRNGEEDWPVRDNIFTSDCLRWRKLYAFLKGYLYGFKHLVIRGNVDGKTIEEEHECFYCEMNARWYPVDRYIANPYIECYVDDKTIVGMS